MPIAVQGIKLVEEVFKDEGELHGFLERNPYLVVAESEPGVATVQSQVSLPNAGNLDILLVDEDGVPLAVEVKLARNPQARREVIGQLVDYRSDIVQLTFDELDELVQGALLNALRKLAGQEEISSLRKRCAGNLRSGRIRLVVAVDKPEDDLIRIVSDLRKQMDVRLVCIHKYDGGRILVPHFLVSDSHAKPSEKKQEPYEPLSEKGKLYKEYWTALIAFLQSKGSTVQCRGSVSTYWLAVKSPILGCWCDFETSVDQKYVGVYIGSAKEQGVTALGRIYRENKAELETRLASNAGDKLDSNYREGCRKFWLGVYREADPSNKADWQGQQEWMEQKMEKLLDAVSPYFPKSEAGAVG